VPDHEVPDAPHAMLGFGVAPYLRALVVPVGLIFPIRAVALERPCAGRNGPAHAHRNASPDFDRNVRGRASDADYSAGQWIGSLLTLPHPGSAQRAARLVTPATSRPAEGPICPKFRLPDNARPSLGSSGSANA